MSYKDWTPERQAEYWRRIKKIKAAHPDKFYPSEYHHIMLEVNLKGAEGMANLEAAFQARLFPFAGWSALCGEGTQLPKSVRKFASQALVHAAALGDVELCKTLHEKLGADVNMKDGKNTALACAVERRRLPAARWLLEHGAKILPNKDGWNPVLWACFDACIPALNMFKHYGIDLNQPYSFWQMRKGIPHRIIFYPIEAAVCSKHPNAPKTVQWLLDNGVSIDKTKGQRHSIREILISRPNFFHPEVRKILARKAAETPEPQAPVVQPTFWKRIHSLLRS